ncbi:MAG: NIL domain-containing protein [Planctomycetota bacterium]
MKKRLFLTFGKSSLDQPILSTLVTRFGVMFNIFGATVNDAEQCVALELEGTPDDIAAAVAYLGESGVGIEDADDRT